MPWSGPAGSQTFSRTDGTRNGTTVWQQAQAASVDIDSPDHDTHDQDIASGLNSALKNDGGNTATANLPMGGFRHTNVGAAASATDYARFSDLQNAKGIYIPASSVGGSADAITLTTGYSTLAYVGGQQFVFIAAGTNSGAAATVNVDGIGAKSLTGPAGSSLSAGLIVQNAVVTINYQATADRFEIATTAPTAIAVGTIMAWPASVIPSGWLECNGQAVSRATYAGLFAGIGTAYGVGDGTTTFNLPDYRGYFLRGQDAGAGNDPDAASRTNRGDGTTGDNVGTKQTDQTRSHNHTANVTDPGHTHTTGNTITGSSAVDGGSGAATRITAIGNTTSSSSTTGITVANVATGGNETRSLNVNVKWIILALPSASFGLSGGTAGYALIGNGGAAATFQGFTQTGTGAVTRTWQAKAQEINAVTDFGCVGDGSTNNFTTLSSAITAAAGKRLYVPEGTYAVTLPSVTGMPDPPASCIIEGAGKDVSVIKFTLSDTSFLNIFRLFHSGVVFRNLTLQIVPSDNQQCTLFSMQASNVKFQNCVITGGVVEGVRISGSATNNDQVKIVFTSSALSGSPITISYTVTTGQSTAQIATGLAGAVNANGTISGAGIVATANGSFVGIAQPDTMSPQASYTTAVTGSATETMTIAPLAAFNTWGCSNTASTDILIENVDLSNMSWSVLKANATTGTNRRWVFRGGRYTQIVNGAVNINSPSGIFDDVLVDGLSIGSVSTNAANGLPIAFSHVTNARIINNGLVGTYNNNAIHIEENSSTLTIAHNTISQITSAALGVGYGGSGIYFVDNNVGGGGFVASNDVTITGNVVVDATGTNQSGYGLYSAINSTVAQRWSVTGNVFSGYAGGINIANLATFTLESNSITAFTSAGTGITHSGGGPGIISGNVISTYTTAISNVGSGIVIRDNKGYNPVGTSAAANVPASPATITAGASPETHYINQSATNTATLAKGTRSIGTLKDASTYYQVHLEPNESYVVTWSTTTPTFVRDIH